MKARPAAASRVALALAAFTTLLAGCSRTEGPFVPASALDTRAQADLQATASTGRADLDAMWPNEDGRRWDYRLVEMAGEFQPPTFHASPADVPAAPGLEELLPLLGGRRGPHSPEPPLPAGWESVTVPFALRFNGLKTTASGVTAQNLEELWETASPMARGAGRSVWERRFLARLAEARPDLRARLGVQDVAADGLPMRFRFPLFLFGYAWEKTAAYIGTYGDLDTRLAWKFLDADLSPGSTFVFQLVPSLADDVFLHAWVVRRGEHRRPRQFARGIQVVYEVDYGIMEGTSFDGSLLGYARPVDFGTVLYAPGVGPVECVERFGAWAGELDKVSAANHLSVVNVTPGPALAQRGEGR